MKKKEKFILFAILGVALLLRLAHWVAVRDDPFFAQLIMDSYEYDRWAQEIAQGDWLGSEIFFQAPLYPYFLGLVYKIFGHHLDMVYLLQIFFAVGGCYALYQAGRKLMDKKLGLAAAALAASYGVFIFYDVQVLKETLAVSLVSFFLWALLEARESGKLFFWVLTGLLCGFLILLRENMMMIVPVLFLLAYKPNEKKGFLLLRCGSLLVGTALILTPVAFRNWKVGGNFLPTTFQAGVNFYIGNNPNASGTYQPIVPGKQIPYYERSEAVRIAEQEVGRELDPVEVSNYWLFKSLSWAKEHPYDFIKLQLKKIRMFWSWYEWPDAVDYYYVKHMSPVMHLPLIEFGGVFLLFVVGLWLGRNQLRKFFPIIIFILAWMVSTIIFFLFSRYRLPAVPGLMLFAAVPIVAIYDSLKKNLFLKTGILAFCCILAFVFSYIRGYKPRMDLVHYNLALTYDNLGQLKKAHDHYQKAIKYNPDDFLSCNNLGNLAAKNMNWGEAIKWYRKAEKIEPNSEGVQCNLGRAFIALNRLDEAEVYFYRALKLNPRSIPALHNTSILLAKKGEFQEAWILNQKVLSLSPDFPPAMRFRSRLKEILIRTK